MAVGSRAIGALPPIGLGAPFDGRPLGPGALERLRALRPAHLRVELDLRGAGWRDVLRAAGADAAALGASLDVAVVTDEAGTGIEALGAALASSPAPVLRFAPFSEQGWVTTRPLAARARAAGLPAAAGGGSRTDFAQLNMQAALIPFAELAFATYAINPQVHAFDDLSIVETLGAQATTVDSARALAGDRPVVVGPVTLRPRFNPNATAPEAPPPPGAAPPQADPRQTAPFAAAWTVGSLHRLAAAGAAALTYFETAGPCGVVDASGAPYPVYEVLAAVAPSAGAELLDVTLRDPLAVEALALRRGAEPPRRPGEPHAGAAGVHRGAAIGPVPLPRARALRDRPDRRSLRRGLKKCAAARTPRSPPRSPAPLAARRYPPPRRPGPPAPPGRRPGRRRAPWRSTAPARARAPGLRARR